MSYTATSDDVIWSGVDSDMENGTLNLWLYFDSDSFLSSDKPIDLFRHHKHYDNASMDRVGWRMEYDTVTGARLRLRLNYPRSGYADKYSTAISLDSDGLLGWHMYTATWDRAATSDNIQFFHDADDIYTAGSDSIPSMTAPSTDTFISGYINGPYRQADTGSMQTAHLAVWKSALTAANVTSLYQAMNQNQGVTVTVFNGGGSFKAIFENPTDLTSYATKFDIRGKRLKLYKPSVYTSRDEGSALAIGEQLMEFDMAYQDDPLVGKDLGDFLITVLPDALPEVDHLDFDGERNDYLKDMALALEPGDRVRVEDAHSGLSEDFWVNGIRGSVTGIGVMKISADVIRAYDIPFWQLGIVGASELGETTFLAY